MALLKSIKVGSLQNFKTLEAASTLDSNALYLTKDDNTAVKAIYKGNQKVAGDFIIVNGDAPQSPEKGVIYYISAYQPAGAAVGKPFVGFHDGANWVPLSDSATIDSIITRVVVLENTVSGYTSGTTRIPGIIERISGYTTTDESGNTEYHPGYDDILTGYTDPNPTGGTPEWVPGLLPDPEHPDVKDRIDEKIEDALEQLEVNDTAEDGKVVVAVNQANGVVSNVKAAITVTEEATPTSGMEKTYDVKVGTTSVGKIDIPFCDSTLENAALSDMNATVDENTGAITPGSPAGDDALVLVFKKGNGKFVGVKVNISSILTESEFKDGLKVEDKEVSVNLGDDNKYIKFGDETTGNKSLRANIVSIADTGLTADNTGLADAFEVKTVIDDVEKVTAAALNNINERIGKEEDLQTTSKVLVGAINELITDIANNGVEWGNI